MSQLRRSGYDRRENQEGATSNQRSGKDRRILSENYLKFIKILEKIPIFKGLTVDQFQKILNICSKRTFEKDEKLCWIGDDSREMFILIRGELKIAFKNGKELSRIQHIGIVGEMGIFTGQQRSASVVAATDCIVLIIHKTELIKLFHEDFIIGIQILMNVIQDLSQKLRNNNVVLEELRQLVLPGEFTKILSKTMTEKDEN